MDSDRIKGGARQVGGRIEEGFGRLADDPETMAEGVARQAAGKGQAMYGQAKDGLRDVADRAADYAEQAYEQGRSYVAQGGRQLNDRVETNPLVAIVAAAALGYLIGLLVRRR